MIFFCVYGILSVICNKVSVENVIKTVCLIKEGERCLYGY